MTLFRNQRHLWATLFVLLLFWPASGQSSSTETGDQILGRWLFPSKGSSVEIYRSGKQYFARIADVAPLGQQQFGITKDKLLMSNLLFDGKNWSGGELIHPRTGIRFSVELELQDAHTLNARVYKGLRWLNKEFTLTRPLVQ